MYINEKQATAVFGSDIVKEAVLDFEFGSNAKFFWADLSPNEILSELQKAQRRINRARNVRQGIRRGLV